MEYSSCARHNLNVKEAQVRPSDRAISNHRDHQSKRRDVASLCVLCKIYHKMGTAQSSRNTTYPCCITATILNNMIIILYFRYRAHFFTDNIYLTTIVNNLYKTKSYIYSIYMSHSCIIPFEIAQQ